MDTRKHDEFEINQLRSDQRSYESVDMLVW